MSGEQLHNLLDNIEEIHGLEEVEIGEWRGESY